MPQVPNKRYDLFIQFFEKRVTEAQKKIEELRKFEPLYNVVRKILEKHDFNNAIDIREEHKTYLNVVITASEDNHWKDFQEFTMDVCKEMIKRKLRDTMITGNISKTSAWLWGWYISTNLSLIVRIYVTFPFNGNKYLKITRTKVQIEDYDYVTEWTEK